MGSVQNGRNNSLQQDMEIRPLTEEASKMIWAEM